MSSAEKMNPLESPLKVQPAASSISRRSFGRIAAAGVGGNWRGGCVAWFIGFWKSA